MTALVLARDAAAVVFGDLRAGRAVRREMADAAERTLADLRARQEEQQRGEAIPTPRSRIDLLHDEIGERLDAGDEAGALDATAAWMAEKDAERLRKDGGS